VIGTKRHNDQSDDDLVDRLWSHDRAALGLLYDRYAPVLFGLMRRIVRSEAIAEDLLQEAFVKAWQNIDRFDRSKGKILAWLLSIARNLALALDRVRSKDFRNRLKNQPLDNTVDQVESVRNVSLDTDTIGVRDMVSTLRPEQRSIVELIYFQGCTQEERHGCARRCCS
jgi:RNA polymerase sigma-70 factor (ECF subfamily)